MGLSPSGRMGRALCRRGALHGTCKALASSELQTGHKSGQRKGGLGKISLLTALGCRGLHLRREVSSAAPSSLLSPPVLSQSTDSLFEGERQLLQPLLLPGDRAGDPILELGQLLKFLLVQLVVVLGRRDHHVLELPAQTPPSLGPL